MRAANAAGAASLAFAVALMCAGAVGAQGAGADGLLREAIDAPNNVSYVGQVQNTEFGQSKAEATIFRIEHDSPNLTRRWYVAPQALYGDSIISRGDTSYNVDIKRNRVIVTKDDALDDQVAQDDNFNLLANNYRAVQGADETIAGRPAASVLLVNKYTGQTVLRVWIDTQTKLVLQKEQYSSNGSVTRQMRFAQIRYVKDVPDGSFQIPTTGFTRVQGASHGTPSNDVAGAIRTAGFQARGPRYLPEGFTPIAADITTIKGIRTLHLLYSDGIRTISLFENARGAAVDLSKYTVHPATVDKQDAQYVQDGPTMLLAWAESGLHFALVGELSEDELSKIASSVVP
ncbi:MAG TPA: sigma-E factor regulatory protein RseB domain-containing protein [Candidatus Baltobacteraceae bacterium]|jgi:negative regulator of sigma E activity